MCLNSKIHQIYQVQKMKNEKFFLTSGDVAKYCEVTVATVCNWIREGKLKAHRTPGKHYRVSKQDFHNFLSTHQMPIDEDFFKNTRNWKRILIVADEEDVVNVLSKALNCRENNYQIAHAYNGFDTGVQVVEFKPHLIILDLKPPLMDGFTGCKQIRENPITQDMKILAISGNSTQDEMKNILKCGADGCLGKPINLSQFRRSVAELLGN